MMSKANLILNIKAGDYFEYFLICAIATILGVRFYLEAAGYPQLGSGGLHIAHMLWGGLLMLAALLCLLTYINKFFYLVAAVLGGIGFGLFIDELGKFITSDNNYFFEPTFSLIYIFFIVLFLVFRVLEKKHTPSEKEATAQAIDLVNQLVTEKYDVGTRNRVLTILKSGKVNPVVVKPLEDMVQAIHIDQGQKSDNITFLDALQRLRDKILRHAWFTRGIMIFFGIFALFELAKAADVISLYFKLQGFSLSFTELGKFSSSIISSLLIALGVVVSRFSSLKGYRMLQLGILFSLFVTQFFDFYNNQLGAVGIFGVNIASLFVIKSLIATHRPIQQ